MQYTEYHKSIRKHPVSLHNSKVLETHFIWKYCGYGTWGLIQHWRTEDKGLISNTHRWIVLEPAKVCCWDHTARKNRMWLRRGATQRRSRIFLGQTSLFWLLEVSTTPYSTSAGMRSRRGHWLLTKVWPSRDGSRPWKTPEVLNPVQKSLKEWTVHDN